MTAIDSVQKDLETFGEDLGKSVIKEVEHFATNGELSSEDDSRMDDATDEEDLKSNATLLADAASLKEIGNAKLKEGSFAAAADDYRKGLDKLKRRGQADNDQEHRLLEIQLNSNLALACLKAEFYFEGTQAATRVLEKEAQNIKVLLRRGVCHSRLGNFEEAKRDFNRVLELDTTNSDARKELNALRPRILEAERKQKAAFSGFFAKTGGTLYSEREAELRKPKNVPDAPERPSPTPAQASSVPAEAARPPAPSENNGAPKKTRSKVTEGVDLDEEDLKILEETKKKGYCYFRRELTEEEKALRETQHVPQKLDASSPGIVQEIATSPTQIKGVSEWNAKGTTYEEKDTSQWCQKMLKPMLKGLTWESEACSSSIDEMMSDPSKFMKVIESVKEGVTNSTKTAAQLASLLEQTNPMRVTITEEPEVKGEAQVMVVRGTKRYFYEFRVKLKWKIELLPSLIGQDKRVFYGSVSVEDFSSTVNDDDLYKNIKIYQSKDQNAADIDQQMLDVCYNNLKKEIVRQRQEFFKIYQDRQ